MFRYLKANRLFTLIIASFILGLIFLFLIYSMLFILSERSFSFEAVRDFHRKDFILYIFDFLPLILILLFGWEAIRIKRIESEVNKLIQEKNEQVNQAIEIARELSEGKYQIEGLKNNRSGELFSALNDLKDALVKKSNEEKNRKKEDQKRNWISHGMAQFGSILRENSQDLNQLSDELLKNIIKYLEINQGGFFISKLDEKNEKYLDLIASYAYDRKKFADKRIDWGEGLIGSCAIEQKSIFMTDIPESYLTITSGLGKSNPKNILLVPMVHNNETKGVIELASFRILENYEIDFIENIAESVAMTIENILNTNQTAELLKETQEQTRELSLQEEKMLQNMEELKATQEQAARQAEKFISFTNSVNHTLIRAEYDINGILLYANTRFLRKLGYSGNREVEGKHISIFIIPKDRFCFEDIWNNLSKGGAHFEGFMKHITKQGKDLWTMATYTCIRDENGDVEKVLFLAIDTTEQKKQSLDFEGQIEAIDRINLKAEFSPDGKWLSSNPLFINTLKFTQNELQNLNIFDFLDRKDIENITETWSFVIRGKAFQGQIRMITKHKEEKWFRATFTSVHDMYDEVSKVIFLASEITNEKIMENESRKQTDQLKRQEEKFRLENLELGKKIREMEKNSRSAIEEKNKFIAALETLLDLRSELIVVINNSGKLIFLNKFASKFFDVKKENYIDFPANKILEEVPNQKKNEFLVNVFEPGRTKEFKEKNIKLLDSKAIPHSFDLSFTEIKQDKEIVYLLMLKEL